MAAQKLSLVQKNSQIQTMKLSQKQIMAMNLIAMGNLELREEVFKKVEENPALELVEDSAFAYKTENKIRTSAVSAATGITADKKQELLENTADNRETLQEHLLHQLNMTNLPEEEFKLCKKIIENLDEKGFHILAPVTLIDKEKAESEELLNRCLGIVQNFDPEGICCTNITESLELQGKLKKDAPKIALFLLHGHLDMLKPPAADKVLKKLSSFLEESEKLSFSKQESEITKSDLSIEEIEKSIKFIQQLDPFPARNFKSSPEHFIQPDAYVTQDENENLKILLSSQTIPEVKISEDIKQNPAFAAQKIQEAEAFLDTLEFRKKVLLNSFKKLTELQKDFFLQGPGHLKPLTQRKFAEITDVHESTVSRMAESKFIRCSWGTFPVKYFFTNSIHSNQTESQVPENQDLSADSVKNEIENILKNNTTGKKLSDQKIADMLEEKGIKIARRTVAKYRSSLNIASSYER